MSELDGPRLPPAAGGKAEQLVVFIHGYGADGNDLIGLGKQWAQTLPHAAFASPDAPQPCTEAPSGYQWFPLASRTPDEFTAGVVEAAPLLEAFIDAELDRLGLPPEALALVGFSQGTMMALHVGLRRATAPVAIVGYSGALAAPEELRREINARPPVLLVHGDMDEVIPIAALAQARNGLVAANVNVKWHISRGTGHGIAPGGLALGGKFLMDCFAK